jgi:DNA polymerase III subunit epsilon
MSFVALDFETATHEPTSACEIGVALVENGRVTATAGWLIRPPQWPHFNWHNVEVHGIQPADVADAPTFAQLWPELQRWLGAGHALVAHNAAFDVRVLRATLAHGGLAVPSGSYACSVQFARKLWPHLENHKLPTVCRHHAIELPRHHRAEGDARACAEITLRALAATGTTSFAGFAATGHARVKDLAA